MSNRELLELAAKTAGWGTGPWVWSERAGGFIYRVNGDRVIWNPLTDDGDALRLAVKLRIHVRHFPHDVEAQIEHRYWREDDGFDPLAATRRAIVRAAAEIGKEMK